MAADWCEKNNVHLPQYGSMDSRIKSKKEPSPLAKVRKELGGARIRCPKCKQRFKVFVRECDDEGCWHAYMPKHKEKARKVKKQTKATRYRAK